MRVVEDPVQDGVGQGWVTGNLVPAVDRRPLLAAPADLRAALVFHTLSSAVMPHLTAAAVSQLKSGLLRAPAMPVPSPPRR